MIRTLCFDAVGDTDEGRCPNQATYGGRLDHDCTPEFLMCSDHAATHRARGDIVEIHSLHLVPDESEGSQP